MWWVILITIAAFKLAKTEEEPRLTTSTFGQDQDFNELVSRLPQLNPKEGKQVTIKIITHFTEKVAHKEENLNCPSRLSKILTHHMKCPLTIQEARPYLNSSLMAGLASKRKVKEILESIIVRENSKNINNTGRSDSQILASMIGNL